MKRAAFLWMVVSSGWVLTLAGCFSAVPPSPTPGPDKQAVGTWYGAALGAGSGAVTGAEVSAATGPGAVIGAGFGAVFGMVSGLGVDMLEEDQLRREDELQTAREQAWAHEVLSEQYAKRLELHPDRNIFPADLFFEGDSAEFRPGANVLIDQIAYLASESTPWSRIAIASYVTSSEPESGYAEFITRKRADRIAQQFVLAGVEPRRVVTQPVTVPEPVVLDPYDRPGRYRQAIEFIALDR